MTRVIRFNRGRYGLLAVLVGIAVIVMLWLSAGGSAATRAVPSNTVLPAISGTPHVGQALTASQGTWTGSPTSFIDQWVRCPASGGQSDGSDCAVIGGAPSISYTVTTGDVDFRLRVRVTATNGEGQATAASNATAVVAVQGGPANTQPPTISGTTTVGSTLTANPGTWSGNSIKFTYQWQRCDTAGAGCTAISGATATSYVLANEDAGHTLRVAVTATDATGPNTLTAAQTAVVTTAGASATGCPTTTGSGQAGTSRR